MTGGEEEIVVVVGTRPTHPNRNRRAVSAVVEVPRRQLTRWMNVLVQQQVGTPAQEHLTDYERRCPSFGTPGSLADLCPDQLYLAPLDVRDSPYESPSPDLKLKMEQGYLTDSGFGPQLSSSNNSGSRR